MLVPGQRGAAHRQVTQAAQRAQRRQVIIRYARAPHQAQRLQPGAAARQQRQQPAAICSGPGKAAVQHQRAQAGACHLKQRSQSGGGAGAGSGAGLAAQALQVGEFQHPQAPQQRPTGSVANASALLVIVVAVAVTTADSAVAAVGGASKEVSEHGGCRQLLKRRRGQPAAAAQAQLLQAVSWTARVEELKQGSVAEAAAAREAEAQGRACMHAELSQQGGEVLQQGGEVGETWIKR